MASVAAALAAYPVMGQTTAEPVGLLLAAGPQARILRRNSKAPVPAQAGEILFAGDRLRAGNGPVSYLYCPGRSSQTLDAQSEAVFQAAEVKVQKGKIVSQQEMAMCFLPQAVQLGVASQQHAGVQVVRGAPPLRLIFPVGGPALDMPPTFAWQPLESADSYQVQVTNAARTVLWTTTLAETEIRYPGHAPPLVAPSTYRWKVTALAGGKPVAATESQFQVRRAAESRQILQDLTEIQAALEQDPSNPAWRLAKAARLERASLLPEALGEYQALKPVWKDAEWLKAKLFRLEQDLLAAQRNVPAQ